MSMIRLLLLVLLLQGMALPLFAQFTRWEAGLLAGVSNHTGDLVEPHWGSFNNLQSAAGPFVRFVGKAHYDLRMHFIYTRVSASDLHSDAASWRRLRAFSVQTNMLELGLQAAWRPLDLVKKNDKLSPYIFAGSGLLLFSPKADFNSNKIEDLIKQAEFDIRQHKPTWKPFFVAGLGADTRFRQRWRLGLEAGLRYIDTDYLDGVSYAGNPRKNDWYGMALLHLSYTWAATDTDGDGIADERDECKLVPGVASLGGCPDADADGVADAADACPDTPGIIALQGCPDADKDGVVDALDACPNEAGEAAWKGCPFKDNDLDGIEDSLDECPTVSGIPELNGCPSTDTDSDGIYDYKDRCPSDFGLDIFDGCPDTDGDGIEDAKDACPTQFGVFANKGCPLEVVADEEAIEINRQFLSFAEKSATIERFSLLDRIADFMQRNNSFKIVIEGFTGAEEKTETANEQLARNRALACRRYLERQGISTERIQYKSYGSRFMLEERSPEEKSFNRRVEFKLQLN